MRRIIAILVLLLILIFIVNNFYVGVTYKKPRQKLSYINFLELKDERIIRKNNVIKKKKKLTEVVVPVNNNPYNIDLTHNATWYSTDGTIVHRDYPTAAYNAVPKGTKLLVQDANSGDSCIVEVTDRMRYKGPNHIDLSHMAFGHLAKHSVGRIKVNVKIIK